MSTPDEKSKKHQGSGRPATKFMERPKPGKQDPSKSNVPSGDVDDEKDDGDEQYWGQGRQQKEREDRQEEK